MLHVIHATLSAFLTNHNLDLHVIKFEDQITIWTCPVISSSDMGYLNKDAFIEGQGYVHKIP